VVRTDLARALWEGEGEERLARHLPLRRIGEPDDVAQPALFFLSDASSWITGQTLAVDGGTTSMASGGVT
jgi:3-oxoacyl-[acyl-carrier protein] reductase